MTATRRLLAHDEDVHTYCTPHDCSYLRDWADEAHVDECNCGQCSNERALADDEALADDYWH